MGVVTSHMEGLGFVEVIVVTHASGSFEATLKVVLNVVVASFVGIIPWVVWCCSCK